MNTFWEKIVSPLYGKYGIYLSIFFSLIPIAFINVPLWASLLILVACNALLLFAPAVGSIILDAVYIWALICAFKTPFDLFSIIFYCFFIYRVLCMIGNYKVNTK